MPTLDLNIIFKGSRVAGKDMGLSARIVLHLAQLDSQSDKINVIVPPNFDCNQSFMDGLFGASIDYCKSEERFYDKFIFSADRPATFSKKLDKSIKRVFNGTIEQDTESE